MADIHSPSSSQSSPNTYVEPLVKRNAVLLEAMANLFEQGQKPHHEAFPDHFGPAQDRAAIIAYLRGFLRPRNPLRSRYGFAYAWFVDDALAGYLLYRLNHTHNAFYGQARWSCYIEDIVVDEGSRGLGGASALMDALTKAIEPLENCAVSGTVWKMNTASEALFHKHGFEPLSQSFYRVSP